MMLTRYAENMRLQEDSIRQYLALPYTYAYYDNNVRIEKFHRRIYHKLSEFEDSLLCHPFSSDASSLYSKFKRRGMISSDQSNGSEKVAISDSQAKRSLRVFNWIMRMVFGILGYKKYQMFLRLLKHYCQYESQIFLLDGKYMAKNVNIPKKKIYNWLYDK